MRLPFAPALTLISIGRTTRAAVAVYAGVRSAVPFTASVTVAILIRGPKREDIYNVLWAVVFGFATLNILSLAARRYEPTRRGLSFGELMAVMVVVISVILLGWEMLNLFHIFPIQIHR